MYSMYKRIYMDSANTIHCQMFHVEQINREHMLNPAI